MIPFSIEKGDDRPTVAAIDISAICCKVLSPFSIENGISLIFAVLEVSFCALTTVVKLLSKF